MVVISLLFTSLISFANEGNQNKLQGVAPILSACGQEDCTKKLDRQSCGKCCYEKYRFTNHGSDDNWPKLQNQAELKPDIQMAWDECVACCSEAFPDKKESVNKTRGK